MSQQNKGRGGKKSYPRKQQKESKPQPTFAPPPNYADPERIKQEQLEQAKIQERLKQNEQLAEAAKSKPSPKKAEYIEEGKSILSSFFNGFNPQEYGNVQGEFDGTLGNRLANQYYDAIEEEINQEDLYAEEDDRNELNKVSCERFYSVVHLAIAIKMGKSGTTDDGKRIKNLSLLSTPTSISIPQKLGVIINQLGKTDMPGENHFRIINQGLRAKQQLVKGVYFYYNASKLSQYLVDHTDQGMKDFYTIQKFHELVTSSYLDRMYDNNSQSLDFIQRLAKDSFNRYRSETNIIASKSNVSFVISLPSFDFDNATMDSVIKYLSNPIFSYSLSAENNKSLKIDQIVAIIMTPVLTIQSIRKTSTKLGSLDEKIGSSYLANVTVQQMLNALGCWNINNFITDNDLDDLSSNILNHWQTSGSKWFSKFLNLSEINFTAFGTDSQVVEMEDKVISKNTETEGKYSLRNRYGLALSKIKDKAKTTVKFKVSETGAIFGSAVRFMKRVNFSSNYEVLFTGKNEKILSDFLKKDFKK